MKKTFLIIFTLFLVFSLCPAKAMAAEDNNGVIYVTLADKSEGKNAVGANLEMYKVASAIYFVDEYRYLAADEFKSYPFPKEGEDYSVDEAVRLSENASPVATAVTDENGKAVFSQVENGLYLIIQTNNVTGFKKMKPFLVILPREVEGVLDFVIDASPKTEVEKLLELTVVKEWNYDSEKPLKVKNVTVELLKNGKKVETVKLNAGNNWTHTWYDIEDPKLYSVREVNIPKGFKPVYTRVNDTVVITNIEKLVQTGMLVWPIPVFAAAGIGLFVIGFIFKKKKAVGISLCVVGILSLAASFSFVCYNNVQSGNAEKASDSIVRKMKNAVDEDVISDSDSYVSDDYIGYITIPALGVELPVAESWSYSKLKATPCRYYGSEKNNDLVICAHNYTSHFGRLKALKPGDTVLLTDGKGIITSYRVNKLEILQPEDIEGMVNSEYDLTLYTCTLGGAQRVAVRCSRNNNI